MPSVLIFCGATDVICICTEISHVTTVSHVMYGNILCYHSLYGFVVGTRMVLQALWESPIPCMENILSMVKPSKGCSNSRISLFKAMLEWLSNCSIQDSSF